MDLIHQLEIKNGKPHLPPVHIGDTIKVHYLIKEGEKERVQLFIGTAIAMTGSGIRRTVTVRRIVQGEGVERIFPLHSPRVMDIEISRRGSVRRAKLYYLRDRVGKKTRVTEAVGEKVRREKALEKAERASIAAATAAAAESAEGGDTSTEPEAVEA